MLEYYKKILEKVSFDRSLMNKEYVKAKRSLPKHERNQLRSWVKEYLMDLRTSEKSR